MTEHSDAAKKKAAAEEKDARDKTREGQERLAEVKPTPTQAENDRTASGEHVIDHEPDGSAPQQPPEQHATRQVEARRPQGHAGSYPTREARARSE